VTSARVESAFHREHKTAVVGILRRKVLVRRRKIQW